MRALHGPLAPSGRATPALPFRLMILRACFLVMSCGLGRLVTFRACRPFVPRTTSSPLDQSLLPSRSSSNIFIHDQALNSSVALTQTAVIASPSSRFTHHLHHVRHLRQCSDEIFGNLFMTLHHWRSSVAQFCP